MTRSFLFKSIMLVAMAATVAECETWSDSLITALSNGNPASVRRLNHKHPLSCEFVLAYAGLVKTPKSIPGGLESLARFDEDIAFILRQNVTNSCITPYQKALGDTGISVGLREKFLEALICGGYKLSAAKKREMSTYFTGLLGTASTPSVLKSRILVDLDRYTASTDNRAYLGLAASQDTAVRSAALRGLASKIRRNRHAGQGDANHAIFDALLKEDSASHDLEQVRTLATISEDYARNYLLVHCAGDPDQMAAIFYRDESLDHLGIIKEALRILNTEAPNRNLAKALQGGTKHPDAVVAQLIRGPNQDTEKGLQLLAYYPKYAAGYAQVIRDGAKSADPGIKRVSEGLTPNLPAQKAAP